VGYFHSVRPIAHRETYSFLTPFPHTNDAPSMFTPALFFHTERIFWDVLKSEVFNFSFCGTMMPYYTRAKFVRAFTILKDVLLITCLRYWYASNTICYWLAHAGVCVWYVVVGLVRYLYVSMRYLLTLLPRLTHGWVVMWLLEIASVFSWKGYNRSRRNNTKVKSLYILLNVYFGIYYFLPFNLHHGIQI
jgi:hypothetical protein